MKKKLQSILLIMALSCTGFTGVNAANGTFGGGDGQSTNPFLIEDAADLNAIRNDLGASYKLTNDIDLSAWITANSSTTGWLPIGDAAGSFKGNLDGNGKTISGLWIDNAIGNNIGLFGIVSGAAPSEIKNVVLSLDPKGIKGKESVGGLVGLANNSADATSVKIENVAVLGNISGSKNGGGIIGYASWASVALNNCYVMGEITVTGDAAGGLWGATWGSGSFNITNCYSICKVSAGATGAAAGLIAAVSASGSYPNVKLNISNSVAMSTTVNGSAGSGRLLGYFKDAAMAITYTNNNALTGTLVNGVVVNNGTATDKNGLNKTAKELAVASSYSAWDFDNVWTMSNGIYPFPVLKSLAADIQLNTFPSDAVYAYTVDVNTSVDGAGGTISSSVSDLVAGNNATTITLTPDANMKLSSLLVNGEDKTADVVGDQYTLTNIISDFVVVAEFSQATNISNASADGLNIYIQNENILTVENKRLEAKLYVYGIAGCVVLTSQTSQTDISSLPQGIYIVKVQDTVTKIAKD